MVQEEVKKKKKKYERGKELGTKYSSLIEEELYEVN